MRRTLMKIGALTFALSVLGGFMANATISGCSAKQQATPEPATPAPAVTMRSTEMPSKNAEPEKSDDYLPPTKVGTFHRHPPQQSSK